ncbi:hypothetical protein M446_5301 [Methylobacterium sp. 4-46]|uniref:hypothetical protein n=1 Tax=unclassified Methylobacterium TaxID=2615210 RepID=UPI000165CB9F|nr:MULTISPECIES: hypothetical protein [Methylobacterium]ACA19622.1 hypothetical protein M446_5301 [Methylobacterium sp. 4-46]WFT78818.1 hypothetical protein QA634_26675 [Methylobacterium nodulans]
MHGSAAIPPPVDGRHHLVVGATAGALCLTSHLLRRDPRAQVTLVEGRPDLCRLLRREDYAAILRTGVADGARWWPEGASTASEPRASGALREAATRLHVAEGVCLRLGRTVGCVAALLDDGTTILARTATVTAAAPAPPRGVEACGPLRVLRLDPADLPLGTGVASLARWLRRVLGEARARGIPWTEAVDGVRLHAPALWHHLPPAARGSLLRHGRRAFDALARRPAEIPAARTNHPLLAQVRAAGPQDALFSADLSDLMPYAPVPDLLDLDAACAWLAARILDGGARGRSRPVTAAVGRASP